MKTLLRLSLALLITQSQTIARTWTSTDGKSIETGVRKNAFKKVKGFQSTGDKDNLVNAGQIENVTDRMKDTGFRQSQPKTFPGGHSKSTEQLAEALDWFLEK